MRKLFRIIFSEDFEPRPDSHAISIIESAETKRDAIEQAKIAIETTRYMNYYFEAAEEMDK